MKRFAHANTIARVIHSGTAPNTRPVLQVCQTTGYAAYKPKVEVELGDWLGMAQTFYEGYLMHDLGLERGSAQFKRLLKRGRRGLGFSYP